MQRMLLIILTLRMIYGQVDYGTQIQTIFDNNCTSCHGYSGGLNLTSYDGLMAGGNSGDVIVPDNHSSSLLWQQVESGDMPQNGSLSSDEVNLIATWIDEGAVQIPTDDEDLFFSEYAEGSGSNKYVEIYNGTGADVDLSSYSLQGTNNGTSWGDNGERDVSLSGTLAAGDVYVIAANEADATILAEADLELAYESPVHHNGDDGIALLKNGAIIDAIGVENDDPGDGWDVAGVTNATKDHTLVRQSSVTEGNGGDWSTSAGTSEENSEWIVYDQNTWDYLGSHPHSTTPDGPSISIVTPENGSTIFTSQVTVEFSVENFSVGSAGDGVDGHIHYQLDGGNAVMHYSTDPISLTNLSEGNHEFLIWLVDDSHGSLDPYAGDEINFNVSETGAITSIYDIQFVSDPETDDASPLNGQEVTIQGVVTAEFWGSDQFRYMFVQDAEGPWNGIVCFEYDGWDDFNWVDASGNPHPGPGEGDEVTLTGMVEEYFNLTELASVTSGIVHGEADEEIEPSLVSLNDIGEAYEGCLLRVEDVTVTNSDLGYGEWEIGDGMTTVRCDDKWDYFYYPAEGHQLADIEGVLDYNYSNYKLQPRLARDVVEEGMARIQRVQQVLYSDLMVTGEDASSDISYMLEDTVTLEGIVTMPTGLSYAGSGIKFIFADVNGGPWSAILSYDPDSSAFPTLYEGDLIQATGYVYEYTSGPANMTELFITEPINIMDFEQPLPVVDTVQTGDLRWPTEAEQWGNVMVRVEDAVVTGNDFQYEVFAADDGSGSVLIDDDSDSIAAFFEVLGPPPVGSLIQSMEGWLYHHYGSYEDSTAYKLCPLYSDDFEFGSGPPSISGTSREPCAPMPSDNEVAVSCVILDNSTITEALVHYTVDGSTYNTVTMSTEDDSVFTGVISLSNVTSNDNSVYYYITATDDGADQSEPKTSQYPYDNEHDQLGFVVTDQLGVVDLQYTPWPSGNTRYEGCEVTVSGVVTADTAQYNSGYSSYALQDPGTQQQWAGLVFDTEEVVEVTRGEHVSITGLVTDYDPDWLFKFGGNTRLINAQVTLVETLNEPDATVVSCEDVHQTADEIESYEGVLVKLNNVTISSVNDFDWSITDESGFQTLIDDDMATFGADNFMGTLVEGQELDHVMGIFNYSYGTYKVQIRDVADLGQTVGIDDDVQVNPYDYALHDNFPNPFNPETQIRFSIGSQEDVKLIVYDVVGRQVRTLIKGSAYDPGFHVVNWNGLDNQGQKVPSGLYIYRIKAGSFIADKKMLLVK